VTICEGKQNNNFNHYKILLIISDMVGVHNMTLSGGFVGVHQDAHTLALRPAIGWLLYSGQEE
jgi:hypothetical protein